MALFGPDWRDPAGLQQHGRDGRKIGAAELTEIYRTHMGVLNIRNEQNVTNGLNQRHFAPYMDATPVVSDLQQDVEVCFDPGTEMLVYRDAAELNALQSELRADPARARTVGLAGQRRVLAQHTYAHRLETMASLVRICGG
jgi:spore maturation protein CgeB